ncbi:hypothetical protein GCM10025885_07780 [Tetragenococcus osmophilus]|uniref:Uncharacterized protein n=1 Tax=Tetragenococcus osmophilus TaxID=526944 RepID=A0AA37XL15_9ENTE|nr:hypothetical protein GCM10025885_07780 [Tetragenococcus osmophilus]
MKQANYHWQLSETVELPQEFIEQLKNESLPLFLGQLLWQRGIKTAEAIKTFFTQRLISFMILSIYLIWKKLLQEFKKRWKMKKRF